MGCGDGPACFYAEMTAQGYIAISADLLYALSVATIERQGEALFDVLMEQLHQNEDDFVWSDFPPMPALGRHRMEVSTGSWPTILNARPNDGL